MIGSARPPALRNSCTHKSNFTWIACIFTERIVLWLPKPYLKHYQICTMKKFYSFLFILILSFFGHQSSAQIVSFCFAGSEGDETSWPTSSEANGVMPSAITRGPGVTAVANADRFNSKNWTTAPTPDLNDYLEFTITPSDGYSVTISTLTLQHQRSVTGPRSFVIRTNLDAFATNATNEVTVPDVNSNLTSTFNFATTITTSSPVIIRIYAYNAEATTGTWGPGESMDGNDMSISGSLRILPVRFVNVKAVLRSKEVDVAWTNVTESDIAYYMVERSANGRDFSALSKVYPVQNSGGSVDYRTIDAQPLNKANFYRVKAVETSGRELYSAIVRIDVGNTNMSFGVYPNPVRAGAQLTLQLGGVTPGSYEVRIYNAAAQLVHRERVSVNGVAATQSIWINQWQKGVYVAEVVGTVRLQQQFIVQ